MDLVGMEAGAEVRGDDHLVLESLGGLDFSRGGRREMRPIRDGFRYGRDDSRMRVPMNQRAEGHHEIDVLVSVSVPDFCAEPAFNHDRA